MRAANSVVVPGALPEANNFCAVQDRDVRKFFLRTKGDFFVFTGLRFLMTDHQTLGRNQIAKMTFSPFPGWPRTANDAQKSRA
jgi:hypothetical protein